MKNIIIPSLFFFICASTLSAQCAYTSFRYEPDYDGCGIRFIDKSEGKDARTWDFGDGFTKTIAGDASILHRYANNGTYKVTLTQGDAKSTQQVTVAKCGVVASVTTPDCTIIGPDYVAAGATVTYQASVVGGQPPYKYVWNINGATLTPNNDVTTVVTIPESARNAETYNLSLSLNGKSCGVKTLTVSGNMPRMKLLVKGNIPNKPIQLTAIDKTGNLLGTEPARFTITNKGTNASSSYPATAGFQYLLSAGLPEGNYEICFEVDGFGTTRTCELYTMGKLVPVVAAPVYQIQPAAIDVVAGSPTIQFKSIKGLRLDNIVCDYYMEWTFTHQQTKRTIVQEWNPLPNYQQKEYVLAEFFTNWSNIGDWDVSVKAYPYLCATRQINKNPNAMISIVEKNKIRISYKPMQLDNVTEVPSCTTPQLKANHSFGAPLNGVFKAYTWRAFAIEGKGGELLNFFNTNNAQTVNINKNHEYFKRYRAGDKVKVLCDITMTDHLDVVRNFNYIADMTLPLRIDADKLQSCSGTTGIATIPKVVAGGTLPYTYSWVGTSDANMQALAKNTLLPSKAINTTATLRITDSKGCIVDKSVKVNVNNVIVITALKPTITLCASGQRRLDDLYSVSGGTGNYRYRWSPADKLDNAYIPNPKITATNASLTGVTFILSVSDDGGCYGEYGFPVGNIGANSNMSSNLPSDATVCYGVDKSIGFFIGRSNTSIHKYQWTSNNPLFNEVTDNTAMKDLPTGTFALPITGKMTTTPGKYDFKLCIKETNTGCVLEKTTKVTVQEQWKLQGYEAEAKAIITSGGASPLAWSSSNNRIIGGEAPFTYKIISEYATSPSFGTESYPNNFQLIASSATMRVTDSKQCSVDISSNKYVKFNRNPILTLSLAKPYYCSQNPSKPADKQLSLNISINTNSIIGITNTGIQVFQSLPAIMTVNVKINLPLIGKSFAIKNNVILKLKDSKTGVYEGVAVLDVNTANRIDNSIMIAYIEAADLTTKNHFLLSPNLIVPVVSLPNSKDYQYDNATCSPTIANNSIYAETITIQTFGYTGYSCTSRRVNPVLNSASVVSFYATNSITIKPDVHIQRGSDVSASIIPPPFFIDCGQKLVDVELREYQIPPITTTDMSIYPNPTNGVINIEYQLQLNEPQLLTLSLYDITGRLVKLLIDSEQHFSGRYYKVFDESSLPQGIYFYKMQVGSQKIIKKVVRM